MKKFMKYSWIMLFCLLFCGCEEREERKQRQEDKDRHTINQSFYLTTVLHDEHLFILSHHGYFIHHFNCPCVEKQTEEKPPSPTIISGPNILDLLKR